jgi:hypothetical protein
MRDRKPDLIVPIRDRRQRKRYLTLKNVRNAMIVVVIVFAAITIRSELRGTSTADYGRLFERGIPTVEQKPVEIVHEAAPPVETQSADPMLVDAMTREQWLTGAVDEPVKIEEIGTVDTARWRTEGAVESGLAIVGGPDGVEVVQKNRRRPVLSGGFGR